MKMMTGDCTQLCQHEYIESSNHRKGKHIKSWKTGILGPNYRGISGNTPQTSKARIKRARPNLDSQYYRVRITSIYTRLSQLQLHPIIAFRKGLAFHYNLSSPASFC